MPTRMIRLRECGLTSPKNRFRAVLNVRAIAMRRELKDKHLKFDERVAPRKEMYKKWMEADRAYHERKPQHIIRLKDQAYFIAVLNLSRATYRKAKRIATLKSMLELVKAALKH